MKVLLMILATFLIFSCATVKPKPEPSPKPETAEEKKDPCDPENAKKDPVQEVLCN